jgi:predicted ATPase
LHLLMEFQRNKETVEVEHNAGDFIFLDTEKQNPRVRDLQSTPEGAYGYSLASRFMSHGESMLPLILNLDKENNKLVFIDEPEAGISLSNQQKILKTFLSVAVNNGLQLVVTTHSYLIIKGVDDVFSLNHKKWIPAKEFLEYSLHE